MLTRIFLVFFFIYHTWVTADMYVDVNDQHEMTFSIPSSQTSIVFLLNQKPYHKHTCIFRAHDSNLLNHSRVSMINEQHNEFQIYFIKQGFYTEIQASTESLSHRSYTFQIKNLSSNALTMHAHCHKVPLPVTIIKNNIRKDKSVNDRDLIVIVDNLTNLIKILMREQRISSTQQLDSYLQQLEIFHPFRYHEKMRMLYEQAWEIIHQKVSSRILLDKKKVPVAYISQENLTVDAIPVENLVELQMLRRKRFLNGHFVLGSINKNGQLSPVEIDCSCTAFWHHRSGFEPIGTEQHPFSGILLGQHSTLWQFWCSQSNRVANATTEPLTYLGLFGRTKQALIDGIHLEGQIHCGGYEEKAGGIAGWATEQSVLQHNTCKVFITGGILSNNGGCVGLMTHNCSLKNNKTRSYIYGIDKSSNGGLVGWSANGTVSQNYVYDSFIQGGHQSSNGGLIGWSVDSTVLENHATNYVQIKGGTDSRNACIVGQATKNNHIALNHAYGPVTREHLSQNHLIVGKSNIGIENHHNNIGHSDVSSLTIPSKYDGWQFHPNSTAVTWVMGIHAPIFIRELIGEYREFAIHYKNLKVSLFGTNYHASLPEALWSKIVSDAQIESFQSYPGYFLPLAHQISQEVNMRHKLSLSVMINYLLYGSNINDK